MVGKEHTPFSYSHTGYRNPWGETAILKATQTGGSRGHGMCLFLHVLTLGGGSVERINPFSCSSRTE